MELVFFSPAEAKSKVGRKVWVKVNNLYDVRKGLSGTVMRTVSLDQGAKGYGVRVDWKSPSSGSGAIMTVFTKNEYECYLNEEPELSIAIAYD